ncbi:MAG: LysM peptidoglycan-binding domain-containing protein, partial [Oscillospiraceae bacterium]|nr:LysM peptidoglycan-binding domain-containing protein [Oscillospiraceae bacterium]
LRSEVPNGYMLSNASMQPQKITAMPTGNGIEVRFTLSCMLEAPRGERGNYLTQLQVFEAESSEEKMPSIVLKRMQKEDSLWEIAKAYLTTADEILAANECTDESQLKDGQMLLIPKKR